MATSLAVGLAACLAFCLAVLSLAGCARQSAAQSAPASEPPPPEVGVVTLQPQRVSVSTDLPGRTAPYLIAEVRPQVGGILQERLFQEGADVKAGAALYRIDPATYQAAVDNAKATLARAKANLAVGKLKADRYSELVTIDAVSKQNYDDAKAAVAQAEADVAAAEAALEMARINLAYTRVTAPISGRIGRSAMTVGALVTAGQEGALSVIQQLDPIYVDVAQASADVIRLRRDLASGRLQQAGKHGAVVKLLLEDGTPYAHAGRLQFSDVTVDEATGAITVRAVFPNPKHELLPGMYVRAVVEEGVADQALLVPQPAVTRDSTGAPIAYIVDRDQKVVLRPLTLRRTLGANWLIDGGLQPGDRVIVEGLQRVRPGITVRAAAPTATSTASAPPPAAAKADAPGARATQE